MLRRVFFNLIALIFVAQVGALLSFPFKVFGFVPERDLIEEADFSRDEISEISVVFFEREGGSLFPKCQLSVGEYPGVLPDFITSSGYFFSLPSYDLKACEQELSLELMAQVEHFELYPQHPQVALAPVVGAAIIVATNLFSCAAGGVMGIWGGMELAEERATDFRGKRDEGFEKHDVEYLGYFPTRGELITGTAPVAGSALAFTQTSAYTEILFGPESSWARTSKVNKSGKQLTKLIKTGSRVAGGAGFVCGVAGGAVGYFMGDKESLNTILNRFTDNLLMF